MPDLLRYARVYENALSSEFCDKLIKQFDQDWDTKLNETHHWDVGDRKFEEMNLCFEPFYWAIEELYVVADKAIEMYRKQLNLEFLPEDYGFEQARMKKYLPSEGEFGWHVDASDHWSSKRFLVCLFYLNTVEEGGETIFGADTKTEIGRINPSGGSILMFPPMWMYPHKATIPISGPKYIVSTYFHYVPQE